MRFLDRRRRRTRRTCSSSSTTTPAWRRGRRTAGGSTCRRWTGSRATASPTRSGTPRRCARRRAPRFLTGPQPPPERVRHDRRVRRPASPATAGTSRPRTPRSATVLRDAGWSTFWVGKNHNVPVDDVRRWAPSTKHWPLGLGYDRFYGFIGGETNNWYPEPDRGQPLRRPAVRRPRTATTCRRTSPTRPCGFIRDSKQSRAGQAVVPVVLPRRQPRAAPRPEEYIAKYKGKFDDGYEAYREWVLARMIETRHPAEGTELTPINPMPSGTFVEARRACARGTRSSDDEKTLFSPDGRGVRRLLRVHRRPGRPDHRLPRGVGPAGEHARSSTAPTTAPRARAARTGRSTRTSSSTAIRTTSSQNLAMIDKLGSPGHLQPLPDRLGDGVLARRTGCSSATSSMQGGTCDPLVIHWPKGIQGPGRGTAPVPPLHRRRPDHPRVLRPDHAGRGGRRSSRRPLAGVSMRATASTTPDAPTTKETQYYEMLEHTRPVAQRLEGCRPNTGPMINKRQHSTTTAGNSFTPMSTAPRRTTWRPSIPRRSRSCPSCGWPRRRGTTSCRSTTMAWKGFTRWSTKSSPPEDGRYTYYPDTSEVPEALGRQNARGVVQDPRRGRVHDGQPGRDRLAGFTFRRIHDVREGRPAEFRLQLPRHRARKKLSCPAPAPGKHVVGVDFAKSSVGEKLEVLGTMTLYVDDAAVATADFRTQSGHYALAGEGLAVGRDSADPVSNGVLARVPRFSRRTASSR